jgi:8-hydroxy-5-deazaflavin:NADPH oxidoreductase
MASAIAARAVVGGNAVELIGRDAAKAKGLAAELGDGATAGTFGAVPACDIVVLAVPYTSAVQVIAQYRDALAGKVIIDIRALVSRESPRTGSFANTDIRPQGAPGLSR